jgi:hypothetical protein
MKDTMMDIVITLALKPSCLLNATKDSDFAIRVAKSVKFRDDARSRGPIQSSATRRMIPVALNHLVQRRSPQGPEHLGLPPHLDCPKGARNPDRWSHELVLRELALPNILGTYGGEGRRARVNDWLAWWLDG